MSLFSFSDGAAMFDATPIENLFLMEYLPVAPEAFLRVYLYARMLALHPELGGDTAQVARALRIDEAVVYDAFAYWEQQGLARRLSDRPPVYELIPIRAEGLNLANPMERDYYAYRDFNASLQALFRDKVIESHEYRIANDWLNVLGYDQAAALRLVEYGIATSRTKDRMPSPVSVFKRMDKLAAAWADRGCRTLEDVERAIAEDEGVYPVAQAVLKRFALRRKPTLDELDCVKRWTGEWGFSQEQILDACGETTKSRAPSFAYLDAILKSRRGDGALWKDLSDILKELDPAQARPSPDQLAQYQALLEAGFESGTVRLAAVQCRRRKQTRLEDVERLLARWGRAGVYTRDAAEAYVAELQRKAERVATLLEKCGSERRPRMDDLKLYDGWRAKHDEALIDCAAECARGAQLPMKYMDKLLTEWDAAGVRKPEAAREQWRAHRARRAPAVPKPNPAPDYAQREYREEDFDDDFFFDVVREYGDGGDKA